MALTTAQKDFISLIDTEAKHILQQGDEPRLLLSLCDKMDKIKEIIDASSETELNQYCEQYDGFYQCMKLLEHLMQSTTQGLFDPLIK